MDEKNKNCKYITETPNGEWCQALQKQCSPIVEGTIEECENLAEETFMRRFEGLEGVLKEK